MWLSLRYFFFQAEDGIRDVAVTGVQTCALPISRDRASPFGHELLREPAVFGPADDDRPVPGGPQPLGEGAPVRDRPAFGGMGGAGCERREPRARESPLREPLRRAGRGAGTEAELGRAAVG